MADGRFYQVAGPFTLAQLAEISGARMDAGADPQRTFIDVAPLAQAGADQVSFLDNRKYAAQLAESKAGAVLLRPGMAGGAPSTMLLLLSDDPYRAYARVAQAFYPPPPVGGGISPAAHVDPGARIGSGCVIEAGAHVGPGAEIGAGCRIGANTVIGAGVVLDEDCTVAANVTLACCLLGPRVVLHPGVRIGQDGFGFAPGAESHEKVPQLGRVIIEADVEIGANSTVDRGAGPDTVIGAGTKIDNLVQIGHNVRIGRGCLVVSQVGISGSTRIGDFVMIGGQAGLAGHLEIGSGARLAAQCGVTRDIAPGAVVAGMPAIEARAHWRRMAALNRLVRKTKDKGLTRKSKE